MAENEYKQSGGIPEWNNDGVQHTLLEENEKAYDIFICCKESDEDGRPTRDCILARNIYKQLTAAGRTVFLSCDEAAGESSKGDIYDALNSAGVMIVVGTKPEHLNDTQVKAQWSSFLALTAQDQQKKLLPCYRDMNPDDMPEQLRSLQSYDMEKLSFLQDLNRSISKALNDEKRNIEKQIVPLLKRAFAFLKVGDWQQADEYCEKVLDISPECAEAYLGKLMAECSVSTQDELENCEEPLEDNKNYQKILRFAAAPLRDAVAGYNAAIQERKVEIASEVEEIPEIAEVIPETVEDILPLVEVVPDQSEEIPEQPEAVSKQEETPEQTEEAPPQIEEIPSLPLQKMPKRRTAPARKVNKNLLLTLIAIAGAAIVIAVTAASVRALVPALKYNKAVSLMKSGRYTEAVAVFDTLGGYKDSREKTKESKVAIIESRYQDAIGLMQTGQYEDAIAIFEDMVDYKDSYAKIAESETAIIEAERLAEIARQEELQRAELARKEEQYQAAAALHEEHRYEEAAAAFQALGDYKDSAAQAEASYFRYELVGIKNAKIGDYVTFGSYEQDNNKANGQEPIEWLVLDIQDGKALVLSKRGLDIKQFHIDYAAVTWETCTLRPWLNEEFMDMAFTDAEKAMIPTMTVPADRHPDVIMADPGNPTQDQMFVLSFVEVLKYLPTDDVLWCMATDYVEAITPSNGAAGCCWVLRTPSSDSTYSIASVIPLETGGFMRPKMGNVYQPRMGHSVNDDLVIRPAMWIDMGT